MVAWRPAIYLDGYMISIGFFAFRKKNPLVALLLVPPMLQSLVIAVTAQLQAVRYQYPVYLIAMLFTIPVFYLAIKQDQK
jgi:uncharacterized membrane protein